MVSIFILSAVFALPIFVAVRASCLKRRIIGVYLYTCKQSWKMEDRSCPRIG